MHKFKCDKDEALQRLSENDGHLRATLLKSI
jgi:hypothetical protein